MTDQEFEINLLKEQLASANRQIQALWERNEVLAERLATRADWTWMWPFLSILGAAGALGAIWGLCELTFRMIK